MKVKFGAVGPLHRIKLSDDNWCNVSMLPALLLKWQRNIAESFNPRVGHTNVTDDRQTGRQHMYLR